MINPDTLTIVDYEEMAEEFNVVEGENDRFNHACCGLVEEVGECFALMKRFVRGDVEELDNEKLSSEMGDVLWYLTELAHSRNLRLSDVAYQNLRKLSKRKAAGTILGEGGQR